MDFFQISNVSHSVFGFFIAHIERGRVWFLRSHFHSKSVIYQFYGIDMKRVNTKHLNSRVIVRVHEERLKLTFFGLYIDNNEHLIYPWIVWPCLVSLLASLFIFSCKTKSVGIVVSLPNVKSKNKNTMNPCSKKNCKFPKSLKGNRQETGMNVVSFHQNMNNMPLRSGVRPCNFSSAYQAQR